MATRNAYVSVFIGLTDNIFFQNNLKTYMKKYFRIQSLQAGDVTYLFKK